MEICIQCEVIRRKIPDPAGNQSHTTTRIWGAVRQSRTVPGQNSSDSEPDSSPGCVLFTQKAREFHDIRSRPVETVGQPDLEGENPV